jgi:hypothetical protein
MTGREKKISLQAAYNELHRNINRIIALRPELFTQQRVKDFDILNNKIRLSNLMYEDFRNALYNLFLLVLKLLDSTLTMYSRTFKNSYRGKYLKRVKRILEETISIDFVIRLTQDLNRELNEKFGSFEMEVAVAHNVNNIEVSLSDSLNFNSLPRANQMPNVMAPAIGREILPIANSYVLRNNISLNGNVNRHQSRRRNRNARLNRSINRNQSRRRNRNTNLNGSMNGNQILRLNRMGNDPENTSLNSPQGIRI